MAKDAVSDFAQVVDLALQSEPGYDFWRKQVTPQKVTQILKTARSLRLQLDDGEAMAVKGARMVGMTWADIALAVGITRQAAWERWHEMTEPIEARDVG